MIALYFAARSLATGEPPKELRSSLSPDSDSAVRDCYGDPLPQGAVARFGTLRWRHAGMVLCLTSSGDGKLVASAGLDQTIRLWDTATGKELRQIKNPAVPDPNAGDFDSVSIVTLAFSPDGKVLASGSYDNSVRLWEVTTGKELRCLRRHKGSVVCVRFSADGRLLASGAMDGTLRVWDPETGKELRQFKGRPGEELTLTFSPDSKGLAAWLGEKDGTITLWEVVTGKEVRRLRGHTDGVLALIFSPDGRFLASGSFDQTVCLWDVSTGRKIRRLGGSAGWVNVVTFSPDGQMLAAGCQDHTIRLWDMATGREARVLGESGPLHRVIGMSGVHSLAFMRDGTTLASAGEEPAIRLWDVATGRDLTSGHRAGMNPITFSPDGKLLVSGSSDGTLRCWDVATGKEIRQFKCGGHGYVRAVPFSANRDLVAFTGVKHDSIRLWDPATGKELRQVLAHRGPLGGITFSPDGRILASADSEGSIRLWDPATGKEIREIQALAAGDNAISFSPDGKLLASGGGEGIVQVWEVPTGKEVRRFPRIVDRFTGEAGHIQCVAFSPDGKTIAAGGGYNDCSVHLWQVDTGKSRWTTHGQHLVYVLGVAFSPDGRSLASGDTDGTCRLWEVATGEERWRFVGHRDAVSRVAFTPDGRALATGSWDTTGLLWDVFGLLGQGTGPRPNRSEMELDQLWAQLAGEDAAKAFLALRALLAAPNASVPFLANHLHPVPREIPPRIAQLVADLDNDQFAVRQKAAEELEKLGAYAEPALRQAVANGPSAEARRRLEPLLERATDPAGSPQHLQALRALEVLELLGSPEARKVLAKLAAGSPRSLLTQDAKRSLERLARRRPEPRASNE